MKPIYNCFQFHGIIFRIVWRNVCFTKYFIIKCFFITCLLPLQSSCGNWGKWRTFLGIYLLNNWIVDLTKYFSRKFFEVIVNSWKYYTVFKMNLKFWIAYTLCTFITKRIDGKCHNDWGRYALPLKPVIRRSWVRISLKFFFQKNFFFTIRSDLIFTVLFWPLHNISIRLYGHFP